MGNPAGLERELKFPRVDLSALRERLAKAAALRRGPSLLEDNLIFDRGRELSDGGRLLRLRRDGAGARLTYKGPATFERGVKVREEWETRIGDAEETERILVALGYEAVRRYQKRREEWVLDNVVVALDHTPIGDFAEFEGDGAEELAARLGFAVDDAEPRSYLELYAEHRKNNPQAPEDMLF